MRDLRLIGVDDGGQHLVLTGPDDERFRVHLDDALRAAVRRDRPRLGQLQIDIGGGLTPRDVQTLVRSGVTAEEVAERAGWSIDKVRRYEAPILAERDHVAGLAQKVGMPGRGPGMVTLAARVAERLAERGVDPQQARWDATRAPDSSWMAILVFQAGGRQRVARWAFDMANKTVVAAEDEARWLGEETSSGGPLPAPHLVTTDGTTAHVYDVEAEGGIKSTRRREGSGAEPVDLMSAMRARTGARGRRTGRRRDPAAHVTDQTPEDALPLTPLAVDPASMGPPPAARGTHRADVAPEPDETIVIDSPSADAPSADSISHPDSGGADDSGDSRMGDSAGSGASADTDPAAVPAPAVDDETEVPATTGRRRSARGGRRSVPSWDDVMFGARD